MKVSNFSENNTNLVLGFISILFVIWIFWFAIPSLFINLFNNILGNFILLGIVILVGMYSPIIAIGLATIFIIFLRIFHMY